MTAVLRLFLHSVWLSLAVAPATAPRAWAEVAAGVSFDAVLALADRALYSGKNAGRNVVEVERDRSYIKAPDKPKEA